MRIVACFGIAVLVLLGCTNEPLRQPPPPLAPMPAAQPGYPVPGQIQALPVPPPAALPPAPPPATPIEPVAEGSTPSLETAAPAKGGKKTGGKKSGGKPSKSGLAKIEAQIEKELADPESSKKIVDALKGVNPPPPKEKKDM